MVGAVPPLAREPLHWPAPRISARCHCALELIERVPQLARRIANVLMRESAATDANR
jgi:hypothetical protein